LKFCGQLHREVCRLLTLKHPTGVNAGQMKSVGDVGSVAHKAPRFGETSIGKDGRKTRTSYQCGEAVSLPKKSGIIDNQNSTDISLCNSREGIFDVIHAACTQAYKTIDSGNDIGPTNEHGNAGAAREKFTQQPQSLRPQILAECGDSRDVGAWSVEARD